MWGTIEKSAEHIGVYSTLLGQVWYLIVFLFRLIVVATIGSAVYSDEQSAFRCSTKVVGCDNVCYDRFAKISHIRFWSFQLLSVACPVVVFHFFAIFTEGRIEKLKEAEKANKEQEKAEQEKKQVEDSKWDLIRNGVKGTQLRKRQKKVGKIKEKQRFNKNNLQIVYFTKNIHFAYFISVLLRMIIEFIFLYLAYDLFRFAEYPNTYDDDRIISDGERLQNPIDLFWIRVPQLYRCTGKTVRWACNQHMLPGNSDSYVPCWVSRPWEKTIFLRYMNTLSVICFFLCIGEIILLLYRFCLAYNRKTKKHFDQEYQKMPLVVEPPTSQSQQPPLPIKAADDLYYTKNEKATEEPKNDDPSQAPPALSPKQSNVFVDLATGKLDIKELKKALAEYDQPKAPRRKSNLATDPRETFKKRNSRVALSTIEVDAPATEKRRTSKPKFKIPEGTQSLNRPRFTKGKYSTVFHLDSSSFTHSEVDNDGSGSESGSSEETERISVSGSAPEEV